MSKVPLWERLAGVSVVACEPGGKRVRGRSDANRVPWLSETRNLQRSADARSRAFNSGMRTWCVACPNEIIPQKVFI